MFWNDVRTVIDGMEKSFEREYAKFDEYGDVEGLSEFKELVVGLRDSDILIEFDKLAHYVVDDSNFDEGSYKSFLDSNKFFERFKKKLANLFIPIHLPFIHGFVSSKDIKALLMLIEFNYFYYSNMRCSRVGTIERVFCGDIILYLSFFTDEFKLMGDLPDYDDSFFTNLRSLTFEDEKTRIIEDFLRCGYFH